MSHLFSILGWEHTMGENHARLLHQYGRADPGSYARGILLYARAQAAFNGLIEEAKSYLTEGIDLAEVEGLDLQIRSAVERRSEFTDFVANQVLTAAAGAKGGIIDLPKPEELFKALVEGLRTLWREHRDLQESRRKELRGQLDALKWRPFEELMDS